MDLVMIVYTGAHTVLSTKGKQIWNLFAFLFHLHRLQPLDTILTAGLVLTLGTRTSLTLSITSIGCTAL